MGPLAAPIIGAVGSLLGGFLNKPKNEYVVPDYQQIRDKAEAAGFNPLFAMANAPGQVVQSGGYMGSAVSDAAMIMADAVSKQSGAGKLSQAQAQNRALSKQVQSLTLRPKIGGIYAQRGVTPNLKQALGVGDVLQGVRRSAVADPDLRAARSDNGGRTGSDQLRPLPDTVAVDPRREVDNAKVTTTSGFMVVDNPNFDFPIYVPSLDGDEALSMGEAPMAGLAIGGSYLYDRYINTPALLKPVAKRRQPADTYLGRKAGQGNVIGGYSGDNRAWPNGIIQGRVIGPPKKRVPYAPYMAISP